MSIAKKAVHGAAWNIGLGIPARAVGAIGTIVITYFLDKEVMGEVVAAWIVVSMASLVTRLGLDQYLIVKQNDGHDVVFHSTLFTFAFGLVGLVPAVIFGPLLAGVLNAPNMGQYILGCAVAVFIRRMGAIVDRVLVRDMRFRASAISQAAGELSFQATQLSLVLVGYGGFAIVYGNIVQSVVIVTVLFGAAGWRSWLTPCRLSWRRFRDMMRFGLPLNFETALHAGSRQLDNLVFSARFGVGQMGLYNLSYSLADIPATHIGEHISGVLLPSMARIEPKNRPRVLVRSTALLAILLFPMAVGLGVVAEPLIAVLLRAEWRGVAPLLTALSVMSIFRPVSWVLASYLKVCERTGTMFWLEAMKFVVLISGIAVVPTPMWACVWVGVTLGLHSLSMIWVVCRQDGIDMRRFAPGFVGPLLACSAMALAVLGVRYGSSYLGLANPAVALVIEISVGVATYVPAAFVFAPRTTADLLELLRASFGRGKRAAGEKPSV